MLKPELIDGLVALVDSMRGVVFTKANADSILEALTLAKSAIPSGQVAEEHRMLAMAIQPWTEGEHKDRLLSALNGLAAQAQSAETHRANWQEAERGQQALLAELEALREERAAPKPEPTAYNSAPTGKMCTADELRTILKACASKTATWPEVDRLKDHIAALEAEADYANGEHAKQKARADMAEAQVVALRDEIAQWQRGSQVSFGESVTLQEAIKRLRADNTRLDGLWTRAVENRDRIAAELDATRKERDDYRQKMMEEAGKFLAEMQRADLLQDNVNRISAAGQVLSEHIGAEDFSERELENAISRLGTRLAQAGLGLECHADFSLLVSMAREANVLRRNLADAQKDAGANAEELERMRIVGTEALSIRDEFAKAAMQALYTSTARQNLEEDTATRAYRMADAMISARGGAVANRAKGKP